MGRKGDGVEVRDSCIRVTFTFEGQPQRQTLMVNGTTMPPTIANIRFAHRLSTEIRDKIRHNNFSMSEYFPAGGDGGMLTVTGQLSNWLASQRIERSTRAGYVAACNFWKITTIGDRPLRALKHSHILTAIATRPDLTGKTINNYVSVLREALALAKLDRLIGENPVAEIPRAKHQKEPPDPFTRDELEKITGDFKVCHPGQVANLVEFWLWTGMRTSELAGLKWTNVDLASSTVLIAQALVRGILKKNTKTNTSRTVKLNSRALAALQAQRQHTEMAGSEVFQDPRYGTPWADERAFRRSYWTPTLKRLGIRYRRPYNMRHTYATTMLMASMTPAFCARQLGHSVDIFLRTYSKWLDGEQNDREMDRLELTLGRPKAKEMTG